MRSPVGGLAEIEQHLHHLGVGAAVQRPLERADRRDHRRVDVGERGGGHAPGEGRRVQLVIGVQRQRDVERLHGQGIRPVAGQHVEEVGGLAHRRIRRDRPAARLQPAPGGDDRAGLRGEPDGLAVLRLRRGVVGLGVVVRQGRRQASAARPCPSTGGRLRIRRMIASGSGRAAASCDCRSPSSARVGSRRCQSR